jgi:hypothetical protein
MSWGDTLNDAWDAATDTARAAANTVVDTAEAAYAAARAAGQQVVAAAERIIDGAIQAIIGVVEWAWGLITSLFSPHPGGGLAVPCHTPIDPGGGGGGGGGTGPHPGPEPTPPVDDYNLVRVDWLDGDDATIIASPLQYVNLPRDAKWLPDSDIPNIDRLGIHPRFLVQFDKPVSVGFQWRIKEVAGGSPAYTTGTDADGTRHEEVRNGRFVPSSREWTSGSVVNGKGIIDVAQVVAGGGYKFQVEAKDDKGTVALTGILTTKRLLWYVKMPMTGLTNVLADTPSMEAEFASHHLIMKKLPDITIPHQRNIDLRNAAQLNLLSANISAALDANPTVKAKAPYLLRISFTDHLAGKRSNVVLSSPPVASGPGSPVVTLGVSAPTLTPPNAMHATQLWNDLVDGESWFVGARFVPAGGGAAIPILGAQVNGVGTGSFLDRVSVDVSNLPPQNGTVEVTVHVVDMWAVGLALHAAGDICVATRAFWQDYAQNTQLSTIIHEIGHKIQQAANGTGIQPDKVATHYVFHGHNGDHCFNGCAATEPNYDTPATIAAATCTMFGTTKGLTTFCGNCAPAVKKADLGAGF